MILSLQKAHRLIWLILSILLPFGFAMALLSMPTEITSLQDIGQSPTTEALIDIVQYHENTDFAVHLRQDSSAKKQQLEIIVKEELTSPSTLVYLVTSQDTTDLGENSFLGTLGSKGTYHFPIDKQSEEQSITVKLYDPIHEKIYQELQLKQ